MAVETGNQEKTKSHKEFESLLNDDFKDRKLKENQIIKVSSFKNKTTAMNYFSLIQSDVNTQKLFSANMLNPLVISDHNFSQLIKEKNINDYLEYFNAIYLLN